MRRSTSWACAVSLSLASMQTLAAAFVESDARIFMCGDIPLRCSGSPALTADEKFDTEVLSYQLSHADDFRQAFGTGTVDIQAIALAGGTVNPAFLRVRAAVGAGGKNGDEIRDISSLGMARFTDFVQLRVPTAPDGRDVNVVINGFLNVSGTVGVISNATEGAVAGGVADVRVRINGVEEFNARRVAVSGPQDPSSTQPSLQVRERLPFSLATISNLDTRFEVELRAVAQGDVVFSNLSGEGNFLSTADFGNTVGWGGITEVIDVLTGLPIEDWQIVSASGFDYSRTFVAPVPVPAGIWLLGSAVVSACWVASRRNAPCARH